jgi:hypothetical protein
VAGDRLAYFGPWLPVDPEPPAAPLFEDVGVVGPDGVEEAGDG